MKKRRKIQKINLNLKLTMLVVGLFFCVIVVRLSYIVLSSNVDGINLTEFANNRNTTKQPLYASRGIIYDHDGKPLAKNANSYKVIAYLSPSRTSDMSKPNHVVDKELTATRLCTVLANDEKTNPSCVESLKKYFSQNLYQVELGAWGKVSEDEKRAIEALELPGIDFETLAKKRQYINSSWASYIIGYARTNDEGEIAGEMGIESYYNDTLKGTDGFIEYQKDAYGYKMANTPENVMEAESGSDIYLTIHSDIQNVLENTITNFSKDKELEWALFTIMDAKTGEIVGSASNPNFNPNNLNGLNSYLNPLVAYQFEPGSTMKIFSWMAAMENGIYDGKSTFKSGTMKLSDNTLIKDFNTVGWGTIDYDTGFAYSSNVAATNLGLKLGTAKLSDFYTLCGFGKKTGITLPGEIEGIVDFIYESELANASFGQGIGVTPVQMLQALSAIANDGVMIQPQIVSKIVDRNGNVTFEAKREEKATVASKETVKKMQELMHKVVYDGFDYNKAYAPEGISIMGKTGTAQIASPYGGYLDGEYDYIKSFAGMFPAENPKYVFYFATKKYVGDGTTIAKTIANAIQDISSVTNLMESQNDVDETKIVSLPQYVSMPIEPVLEDVKKRKLQPIVIGNGTHVTRQYPAYGTTVVDTGKVFLLTNQTEIKMPDVVGWSTNEILRFCNLIGLNYQLTGYGNVVSTSIAKDTVLDVSSMVLEITLG